MLLKLKKCSPIKTWILSPVVAVFIIIVEKKNCCFPIVGSGFTHFFFPWRPVVTHILIHFPTLSCSLFPKKFLHLSPPPHQFKDKLILSGRLFYSCVLQTQNVVFSMNSDFPFVFEVLVLNPIHEEFRGKRAIYVIFIILAGNTSLITCDGGIPSFTGRK